MDDDDDLDDEGSQPLPMSSKGKALTSPSLFLVSQDIVAPEPTTQTLPNKSSNSPNEPDADPPMAPPPPSSLPIQSQNLDSLIVNETPVTNSRTMEEPERTSTQSSKKTKKGGQRRKAKAPAMPATTDGGTTSASSAPTRSSAHATTLKRKQPDTIMTTAEKPQPAKKMCVQDRWEYVVVTV